MTLRIAVLSDVHGNMPALEAVLNDIANETVDLAVCLGDLAFRGPIPGLLREKGSTRAIRCSPKHWQQ